MSRLSIDAAERARITAYWPKFLARIAAGAIIGRELEASGITRDSVRCYLASEPDARKEWDEAREASAEAFFDDAIEITYNARDAKLARAQADLLLRFAARRNPRAYSERTTVDLNVRSIDLTAIIRDAQVRLEQQRGRLIEHEPAPVVPVAIEKVLLADLL